MDTVPSILLSLPIYLLKSIVVCVSKRSTKDHFKLKMTCRALREISELPYVYASVHLFHLDHNYWSNDAVFLKECYDHGNPYAIYMNGCHDFFWFSEQEKGLAKMKLAEDKGSIVAVYTYAMLWYILWDDSTHFHTLIRESIGNISSDFVDRVRLCQPHYLPLLEKKTFSEEDVYYLIYFCKCTPYDEWYYWYEEEAKGPDICDQCFWTREVAIFFKFFGFNAFVNTIEW